MELTTSWKREGIEQGLALGRQEGRQEGEAKATANLVTRLLRRRFGAALMGHEPQLANLSLTQWEDLAEALLDFKDTSDLAQWLARQS